MISISAFTWIDFFVVAVLIFSTIFATARGLISSLLGFIGWVAAIYLALTYAEPVAKHLPLNLFGDAAKHGMLNIALAFIIVFLLTVIGVALLSRIFSKLVDTIGLSPVDRVLGLAFGILRGMVLVLVLAIALELFGFANYPAWGNSVTRPLADRTLAYLWPFLPKKLAHAWAQ